MRDDSVGLPPCTVRLCTADDAPRLALVGAATLLDAYAGFLPGDALVLHAAKHHHPAAYEAELARPHSRAWLAEVAPAAAPVGYAMLTAPEFPVELIGPGDLELRRIYVLSRFHGVGTARELMEAAIASASEQGAPHLLLGLHPENHRAMAFYRKHGFKQVGTRRFYLGQTPFEDPVMRLTL